MPKPDPTAALDEAVEALVERHARVHWEDVATILIGRGVALHLDAVGLAETASLLHALAEAIEERVGDHGRAIH